MEHLRMAAFNLRKAQEWYRSLMAESARGLRILPHDEEEARDEILFYARMIRRELDAQVDARRTERTV